MSYNTNLGKCHTLPSQMNVISSPNSQHAQMEFEKPETCSMHINDNSATVKHCRFFAFPHARYWKPKQTAHAETEFVWSTVYRKRC